MGHLSSDAGHGYALAADAARYQVSNPTPTVSYLSATPSHGNNAQQQYMQQAPVQPMAAPQYMQQAPVQTIAAPKMMVQQAPAQTMAAPKYIQQTPVQSSAAPADDGSAGTSPDYGSPAIL